MGLFCDRCGSKKNVNEYKFPVDPVKIINATPDMVMEKCLCIECLTGFWRWFYKKGE